ESIPRISNCSRTGRIAPRPQRGKPHDQLRGAINMTKQTSGTKRTSGDPRDEVALDADGRHWFAVSSGSRFCGFKTEDDARPLSAPKLIRGYCSSSEPSC